MSFVSAAADVLSTVWHDPSNRGQRLRRIAMAVAWQAYKRASGRPLILRLDNGMLFYADPKVPFSSCPVYSRVYEGRVVEFVRAHCVSGGAFVDVGAHVGIYGLLLAHQFRVGMCFEPAPETFSTLLKNFAINELKFEVRQVAVSSKEGHALLGSSKPYSETASLVQAADPLRQDVSLVRLDDALLGWPHEVTFLKIDAEGHELEVLRGARETVARNARVLIQFEKHIGVAEGCIEFLRERGFRCFVVDGGAPEKVDVETAYNILACGPAHPLHESLPH